MCGYVRRNFLDPAFSKKRRCTFKGQQEKESRVGSAWKPTGSALAAYRAANEERAVRQLGEGRLAVGENEKVRWADELA
jgi:hypothetical protein